MAEYIAHRNLDRIASHPGEILREEIMPALGKTVTEVASLLRVSRQHFHSLLAEQSGVSPAMALRLGKLFGNSPEFWLNLQRNFDLSVTRKEMAKELELIPTLAPASK